MDVSAGNSRGHTFVCLSVTDDARLANGSSFRNVGESGADREFERMANYSPATINGLGALQ